MPARRGAQTVANALAAMEHNLAIVRVINKIGPAQARVDEVLQEMVHSLAIAPSDVLRVKRKTSGVAGQSTELSMR